ncbi:hypothetical protein Ga0080559_TMP4863 [Salipiger profundus]|uniref:Uncharacterized protein n=1 Tax=Salipiger profundus TaxID=1229727 RepID=A0A1U7DBZ6_9RHOB|nr:hypothetical protein Ga0080559_TMP4863 [Salipiger profundus]
MRPAKPWLTQRSSDCGPREPGFARCSRKRAAFALCRSVKTCGGHADFAPRSRCDHGACAGCVYLWST